MKEYVTGADRENDDNISSVKKLKGDKTVGQSDVHRHNFLELEGHAGTVQK